MVAVAPVYFHHNGVSVLFPSSVDARASTFSVSEPYFSSQHLNRTSTVNKTILCDAISAMQFFVGFTSAQIFQLIVTSTCSKKHLHR